MAIHEVARARGVVGREGGTTTRREDPGQPQAGWPSGFEASGLAPVLIDGDLGSGARLLGTLGRTAGNASVADLVASSAVAQRRTVRQDYAAIPSETGPVWDVVLTIARAPSQDTEDFDDFVEACRDGILAAARSNATTGRRRIAVTVRYRRGADPSDVEAEAFRLASRSIPGRREDASPRREEPTRAPTEPIETRRLRDPAWEGTYVDGMLAVQDAVRAAVTAGRDRMTLEIAVEPGFVGVLTSSSTGQVGRGTSESGAVEIFNAAVRALDFVADQAPTSRRTYTIRLERTGARWQRTSLFLTSRVFAAGEARADTPSGSSDDVRGILRHAASGRRANVRIDLIIGPEGVRIASWAASGRAGPTEVVSSDPTAEAVRGVAGLIEASAGGSDYPRVYEVRFDAGNGVWRLDRWRFLTEIRPAPPRARTGGAAGEPPLDEGAMLIEDVRASRRLVLTTAATLIEEQNPARLDNILFSIGPFGITRVARVGRLGRLGRFARFLGRPARAAFGEVRFRGLVQNRSLRDLTHNEIYDAFRSTQFRPSSHCVMRLKDPRTRALGFDNLNDVARHMNRGLVEEAGDGLVAVRHGDMDMIVNPETNILVTFRPR